MILVVCSMEDISSMNMAEQLVSRSEWSEIDSDALPRGLMEMKVSADMALAYIPGTHIRTDDVDEMAGKAIGSKFSDMVFLSRHKAASGIPTLTVHPIGNHGRADFGGRDGELVPASPHLMTGLLRSMNISCSDLPFQISFEVTHHGPWCSTPALFLEIGSDESQWGNKLAAERLVDSLLQTDRNEFPAVIGLGGGHYAPQFTETSLSKKVSFGHMIPNYALKGKDDDAVSSMIYRAAETSGTKLTYIHRKSMKRSEASHLQSVTESMGLEVISSKDLDPL